MCIVFFTLSQPGYPLILAANRDEFLDRTSSTAAWHNFDNPQEDKWALSGRDLTSGDRGTWLGLTKDLRVGTLTNIRYPLTPPPPHAPSRGRLLKSFLAPPPSGAISVDDYLSTIDPDRYVGFNLLLFRLHKTENGWGDTEIGYISNRPSATKLTPTAEGCSGMSNSPLAQPYPKVVDGERCMNETLEEWTRNGEDDDALVERLMTLLSPAPPVHSAEDMTRATRVNPFLIGSNAESSNEPSGTPRWYGTRISTVILVREDGQVIFIERDIAVLDNNGQPIPGTSQRKEVFHAQ